MEKIAVVCALKDEASVSIATSLKEMGLPKWANYYEFDADTVALPFEKIAEQNIIVVSKHQSAAGTVSLTSHSIGNFGSADFGGVSKKLVGSLPKIQSNYVRWFEQEAKKRGHEHFSVCLEVTHHGPFIEGKNVCFIELGSSIKEWTNNEYAKLVAENVVETTLKENNDKICIGIGGGHYAPDFTKLVLRKNFSFGHICPQYNLENLNEDTLEQMIRLSGAEMIIIDWKGLKGNKEKVLSLCEKSSLPFERVQRLV